MMGVVELLSRRLGQSSTFLGVELPHGGLDVLVVRAVAEQVEGALGMEHAAPGEDRLVERRRAVHPVCLVRLSGAALATEGADHLGKTLGVASDRLPGARDG